MSQDKLHDYYDRELKFLRAQAEVFARENPAAAGRLALGGRGESRDPHVERLMEGFALVAGRIHKRLDDDFPELSHGLMDILYPHYLRIVPSLCMVRLELDAARTAFPAGHAIPRDSALTARAVNDFGDNCSCEYRTTSPLTLWPVGVVAAELQLPNFRLQAKFPTPPGTAAVLRLELEARGEHRFGQLELSSLRFSINESLDDAQAIHELLLNHDSRPRGQNSYVRRAVFRNPDAKGPDAPEIVLPLDQCLVQTGFEDDESLFPYPAQSNPAYRYLAEYFAFPQKFLQLDLKGGWDFARKNNFGRRMEILFYLDRVPRDLERKIKPKTFLTGCVPAVNLFPMSAARIELDHTKQELPVVVEPGHSARYEVFSVEAVTRTDRKTRRETAFQPFFAIRQGDGDDSRQFWQVIRRRATDKIRLADQTEDTLPGTETSVRIVDTDFRPAVHGESSLDVETLCTNRDFPTAFEQTDPGFTMVRQAPTFPVECPVYPTDPYRPPLQDQLYWRLISHLSLNHLSLVDGESSLDALKEMLRLYDYSASDRRGDRKNFIGQALAGLIGVRSQRVVGRTSGPIAGGLCRGIEVTVKFDATRYPGSGWFLFATVLERFLALHASLNSFTQLRVETQPHPGYENRHWPPRDGMRPLL